MIRDSLLAWKSTTELLIRILAVHKEELRDGVIEQVEHLLNKRDELQKTIQAPFTDQEKAFSQELLQIEKKLDTALKVYLKDIRGDIEVQQKKKVSVHAYMDPYNKVFRDGTFYDNKN